MYAHLLLMMLAYGAVGLGGCSLLGLPDEDVRPMSIQAVALVRQEGRSVAFEVTSLWPNTCGAFDHFETQQEGHDYAVRMFGRQPRHAICGEAITPVQATWTTDVPAPGTYRFHFWQSDSTAVDTTLAF